MDGMLMAIESMVEQKWLDPHSVRNTAGDTLLTSFVVSTPTSLLSSKQVPLRCPVSFPLPTAGSLRSSFILAHTVSKFTTAVSSIKDDNGLMDIPCGQTCLGTCIGKPSTNYRLQNGGGNVLSENRP